MDQKSTSQPSQNTPAPKPPTRQPYYVGTMPAEPSVKNPGRTEGVIAIICAAISLLFIPILFGVIGILLAVKAKNKGQRALGLVGIILSAVFMVIGIILGALAHTYLPASRSFVGMW